ncbi:MAG: flagellar export chaperone FliS [Bdellovibrionales bacterium RBG_16_40_8]|nr:MAG: flagellar export chaperone FliS [Bdellovibrionales bacterium RBG_16_40_8]
MNEAYKKYKVNSVQTASREKILLMLYEAAIKFTKKAIVACEEKNISDRGYNIGRAFDIVNELNNSLNHKINQDLCKNLEQLYMFITDQFVQANVSGKTEHLKNALRILETLNGGWMQAVEQIKKEGKVGQST